MGNQPSTSYLAANNNGLRNKLLTSCLVLSIFFAVTVLIFPQLNRFFNLKTTDIILGGSKGTGAKIEVVIVDIDEASLSKYGQWPWPRYRLARLLKKIQSGGAKSIGIDILFPEQDRTSPKMWQKAMQEDFGYTFDTSTLPDNIIDHDAILAKTLANGPFVLGYEFLFDKAGTQTNPWCLTSLAIKQENPHGLLNTNQNFHQATGIICSYKPLAQATQDTGFLNGVVDSDGIFRRLPLLIEFEDKLYPSFVLAALMKFFQSKSLTLADNGGFSRYLSLNSLRLPMDDFGNFILGPTTPAKTAHLSAGDLLGENFNLQLLQDKIVLVGSTASGLAQLYPTPYAPGISLIDLHKQFIESILSDRPTIRSAIFPVYEFAAGFILCMLLTICIVRLQTLYSSTFFISFILLSWASASIIYSISGYLFSPFLPIIMLICHYCLLIIVKARHLQSLAKAEANEAFLMLKSSENSLLSIINTVPDIIFRLDSSGRITFLSPAISSYRNTSTSLIGHSIFDLVAPEDISRAQYKINERRTGNRATMDLQIRLLLTKEDSPAGDLRFFSISTRGIYQNDNPKQGKFLGTQGVVRDITQRKLLENQLLQAQKMEAVGNLAAGIAHDLNNILSGLVSYPDLLLLDIPEDSHLHKKISVIQKSGKKAAVIVQDLLTLARQSVRIDDICDMNRIISDYLDSVEFQRLKANYPKITIHTELHTKPLNIKGSAVHLSKVIMNIMHNAMEAMPAGGSIKITTFNTHITPHLNGYEKIPQGEYSCTSISDSGVGISDVDLGRIFEPFYTKKMMGRSGTGLGMTVIWATVKDHKGYIDIKSGEGQGTTFSLYIPTTRQTTDSQPQRIVLEDLVGTETLLVVDDIAEQLQIAEGMLTKLGYSVRTAISGEEAIKLIDEQPADLVILDMVMDGGLDGLDTYLGILDISPDQKAIITSGFSQSNRVEKLKELGVTGYVQKPYSMEKLGMAVRRAFSVSLPEKTDS